MAAQASSDFKTSTILVYIILNGKEGLTGCGLHEYSHVSVLFKHVNSIIAVSLFLKHFCSCFKCVFFLSLLDSLAVEEMWMTTSSVS